jgi:hypothetical protein
MNFKDEQLFAHLPLPPLVQERISIGIIGSCFYRSFFYLYSTQLSVFLIITYSIAAVPHHVAEL